MDDIELHKQWLSKQLRNEKIIKTIMFMFLLTSVSTTLIILLTFAKESLTFFKGVSLWEFFGSTVWSPLFKPSHFGVWALVSGTILVASIALIIAIPLGLAGAVFLAEYSPESLRTPLKSLLEILAGIPSIVYGYFALTLVTPLLQNIMPVEIFNALSAGIVLGAMILPMITSISEDVLRSIPVSLRMGAYALGATKAEVIFKIVLPAGISGITASIILAFSRAIGETMLVTIAAGSTPVFSFNPMKSIQTMTGYIAQVGMGETPYGTVEYATIYAVGLLLFILTFGLNILSQQLVRKFREVYQ